MNIGIISALEEEISLLREYFVFEATYKCGSVTVTETSMFSNRVFLAIGGVGKTSAAVATHVLISEMNCEVVLNTGLAGGCENNLRPGDAVLASASVYHDFHPAGFGAIYEKQVFRSSVMLNTTAIEVMASQGLGYISGVVATGDIFVSNKQLMQQIVTDTNCVCVDMELAAIAHICFLNNIPYLSLKIISDSADESAADDFQFSLSVYAQYCSSFIYSLVKQLSL